jgi:hypothetical protein
MSVTSNIMNNQLAAGDEALTIVAELNAAAYAPHLADIEAHGNFAKAPWEAEVVQLVDDLRDAWADRENAAGGQSNEAKDIEGGIAAGVVWINHARSVLRQADRLGVPNANHALSLCDTDGTIDSYRTGASQIHRLHRYLASLGDLAPLGLRPDFLPQGEAILAGLERDRDQRVGHQVGISVYAGAVYELMVTLADRIERLNDAREVTEIRTGRRLPGFDLRLIRGAAAQARQILAAATPPTSPDAAPDAANTPDADPAPATGL